MMKDNHVAGEGNAYYTLFREYDPDLGRWWRPDPIFQPWQSPYSAYDGNPIMLTDVWGLEAKKEEAPPKWTEQNPCRLPEVTIIDDAPEGTRKIEYVSGYSMPIYLAKHDGKWISATEYGGKMENLVNNLNNKDYDPSSDGFNLDEPLSDSFLSEFATRASRQWGNQSHLLNKIFEKGGYRNPFFAGHGLEDNSQEMAGLFGLAGGLFKKAFGWLAGKSAATLSVEAVEAAAKDVVETGVSILNNRISIQKQARHLFGTAGEGKGYMMSIKDAQSVLDAVHNKTADILGVSKGGHMVVKVKSIKGINVNLGNNITSQETNVFMIKGTRSPSVVPTSPNWQP